MKNAALSVEQIMDKTTAKDLECKSDCVGRHSHALCCVCLGVFCVYVFPKLEHLPTMQLDHQQFSLSFWFLAANVASGKEKQTTEVLHAFLTRSASYQV